MWEYVKSHQPLFLLVLGHLAGICLGIAEKRRGQVQIYDSVLRYSYRAEDWRPEFMRRTFCSLVNAKKPLLHVDGSELPEWKTKVHRILLFAMFTLVVVIVILMISPPESEGMNVEWTQWAWLAPAAPTFFLLYYSVRLAGKTHRTRLQIRSKKKDGRWRTIMITATRDEDGMPTRDVNVDDRRVAS